jgi:TPR repeat protein
MIKKVLQCLFSFALGLSISGCGESEFAKIQIAAEQGNAQAQHNLGVMYADGQGVKQDYAAAVQWFEKAAKQGIAQAQTNLGVLYETGQGVKQDYAAARRWYEQAAGQGFVEAQNHLKELGVTQ